VTTVRIKSYCLFPQSFSSVKFKLICFVTILSISLKSRSCKNDHILETMVRWLAPVLSFTAEEIWQSMPDEKNDSIFLQEWYQVLDVSYAHCVWQLSFPVWCIVYP
jgi:leucyl-tRNA synthetase